MRLQTQSEDFMLSKEDRQKLLDLETERNRKEQIDNELKEELDRARQLYLAKFITQKNLAKERVIELAQLQEANKKFNTICYNQNLTIKIPTINDTTNYSLTCDYAETDPSVFTQKEKPSFFRVTLINSYLVYRSSQDEPKKFTSKIILSSDNSKVVEQIQLKLITTEKICPFILDSIYELIAPATKENFQLKLLKENTNE